MKFDAHIHHRRSLRLRGFDYSQAGAYFVTLVTEGRANLFGEIADEVMCLNWLGEVIRSTWLRLPVYFPVELDEWVIMPNHLHAILWIFDSRRGEISARLDASPFAPSTSQAEWAPWRSPSDASLLSHAIGTKSGSLGAIIQNFKSVTTRKIHTRHKGEASVELEASPQQPGSQRRIWQRNYYDHIIRNQTELEQICQYIAANPHRWCEDQ